MPKQFIRQNWHKNKNLEKIKNDLLTERQIIENFYPNHQLKLNNQ